MTNRERLILAIAALRKIAEFGSQTVTGTPNPNRTFVIAGSLPIQWAAETLKILDPPKAKEETMDNETEHKVWEQLPNLRTLPGDSSRRLMRVLGEYNPTAALTPKHRDWLREVGWHYRVQLSSLGVVVPPEWRPKNARLEASMQKELQKLAAWEKNAKEVAEKP